SAAARRALTCRAEAERSFEMTVCALNQAASWRSCQVRDTSPIEYAAARLPIALPGEGAASSITERVGEKKTQFGDVASRRAAFSTSAEACESLLLSRTLCDSSRLRRSLR